MTPKRWTLVVVCAATAMLMLDIAVVNTALSRIADDLDAGLSGLQWVVDAYTLALASVVLTAGSLADRFGRRRLFTIGLVVFTLASAACAAATDIVFLDAARAVQGMGAAVMFGVSLAILAHAFPAPRERAGALAAYGATIGGTFAIGPLVGGALTSGLDWQWIFLVNLRSARPPSGSRALTSPSPATRAHPASTGSARPRSPAASSSSCWACCVATTTAGARPRSSPSSPARPRCWRCSSRSRAAQRSRCCR